MAGHKSSWVRSRTVALTTLAGLLLSGLVLAAPAQAYHFNPIVSCQALPVTPDQVQWRREYSEGTSYWSWTARTRAECHWYRVDGHHWDFQVRVLTSFYYSYNSASPIGSVYSSPTWTSTLMYGTSQVFNNDMWASYYWTTCIPGQQYVIKTEAFYRFKRSGTSTWNNWDSFQHSPASSVNLRLC
jgi:hypothetical protein